VIFIDPSKSRLIPASLSWFQQNYKSILVYTGLRWSSSIPAILDWSQQVSTDLYRTTRSYWSLNHYGDLHQSQQVSIDPSKSLLISTGPQVPIGLYRTTPSPYWSQQDDEYLIISIGLRWSSSILASLDWSQQVSTDPSKTTSSYWSLQDYSDLLLSQQVSIYPSKTTSPYWYLQNYGDFYRFQQVSTDPSKSLLIPASLDRSQQGCIDPRKLQVPICL